MTKEKKLTELTSTIRNDLPELMKPNIGCFIKHSIYGIFEIIGQNKDGRWDCYQSLENSEDGRSGDWFFFNIEEDPDIEIIGREPTLVNILEWAHIDGIHFFMIHDLGRFCIYNDVTKELTYLPIKWDLSKLYLKDQSEETINYLCKLI